MSELMLIAILLVIMIVTSVLALFLRDLLAAIILFSVFSYFAVLTYLALGSPDVAFTEAVIGVVSTTYFITTLRKLKRGSS
jgi:energy-converting hydrogenase B subunit D